MVDTWAVPADIAKIVVTASLDDPGATFAGTEPTATVRDADSGQVLVTFTPPKLSRETALVVVEVYRRGAEWKIRGVGQGYADGLAGIATDFGVSVEEPAAQTAAPVPPRLPLPPARPPPSRRCPRTRRRPLRPPRPRRRSPWTRAVSRWSRAARSRW